MLVMVVVVLPSSHAREGERHCGTTRGGIVGGEVDVLLHLLQLHLLHLLHLLSHILFLPLVPPALHNSEIENEKILEKSRIDFVLY